MRFSWIRARGAVVVSTTIMALQGVPAIAQFVPYGGSPTQGYNQPVQGYNQPSQGYNHPGQGYNTQQANTSQQQPYTNQQQAYTASLPQTQYKTKPQFTPYGQPQYNAQPQYTTMAYQGSDTRAGSPSLNQPSESIGPGVVQEGVQATPSYSADPASYPHSAQSYNSYPTGGYAGGSYNTFDNSCGTGSPYGACDTGCGTGGGYLGRRRGCRQWFGGIYGLYMERAGNDWVPLAFSAPGAVGYYPTSSDYVLNLQNINQTTHSGVEFRLGSTFGGGGGCGCDDGCGGGCGPKLAWELVYWGLLEDSETAWAFDIGGERLYGNIDYRGLTYNGRLVNHYYDYGPPTTDNTVPTDVEVQSFRVRSTFSAQNIELNLLRLPMLTSDCGCATSCSSGGCTTGTCGIGSRGGNGCGGPRYSVTTLAGARYMRIDEDFFNRTDFIDDPGGANTAGYLDHNIEADNHLVGFQLGCNGVYHCGCSGRWAVHCNANAGIFGNHSEVTQRFYTSGGDVTYTNGGATVNVNAEDDTVATIAEIRAGVSYQYSCNWRFYGGYRAMGISGVALSFDQIPTDYSSGSQVSYVDSNGSIFLHGLRAGVEFTY